jgi:hypothetical protein
VNALTGDAMLAMLAIGDRDIRQANRYLKKRDTRVRGAFHALDAPIVKQRAISRAGTRNGRRSDRCRRKTYGTPEEGLEPPTR